MIVTNRRRLLLMLEYLGLFVVAPLLLAGRLLPVPLLVVLWTFAAACLAALLASPDFDRRRLWAANGVGSHLGRALGPFLVAAPLLLLVTWWMDPDRMFAFVRTRPATWFAVMLLYPVLSAYPQSIIYRDYIFHRYRPLFPERWALIGASALAFCLVHLLFRNWLAPALSLAGGLLFAWTYERTRSTLVATIQHAAFGCWLFTIGLGWYFYYGAALG
jgi:membrane protease YdiL (CAAX protease family)